ncbi:MAG TPA: hypothetical protein V6C91_11320 [Coleofasciculaceae cyanobacterium]
MGLSLLDVPLSWVYLLKSGYVVLLHIRQFHCHARIVFPKRAIAPA